MQHSQPGADGAEGFLTMRECRAIFHFADRELRQAISKGRLPITIINGRILIAPGVRHG